MGSITWSSRGKFTSVRPTQLSRSRTTILIVCLGLTLGLKASVTTVVVEGPSMNPTLHTGQYLVVNRLYSKPQQGDLIVVDRWFNDRPIVKRIYRTEGQPVEWQRAPQYISIPDSFHYVVPKGTVYLLGDNPGNSEDSRFYGPVPVDRIVGRVVAAGH